MNTPPPIPPVISPAPTITYELTRWDLFANSMTIVLRNRLLQVLILATFLVNGCLILLPKLRTDSISSIVLSAVLLAISLAACIFLFQTVMSLAIAFVLKQKGVVGQHTLAVTEQGLVERTEFNETLHKWPSVCRILSLFGYWYIYVGDSNAHQVPKRCFPPQQIDSFIADLRGHAKHLGN